ncbi:Ig-like domain-containing protein [Corallococcus sicarius]|uniref:Ig-like domain-containing protein n=1 Tax=Corallococcus sicarius TaxID=2316726 RepID=UPI001ABF270D|nr:Ig-like domain-containing protein [Corallococcus sicarius]
MDTTQPDAGVFQERTWAPVNGLSGARTLVVGGVAVAATASSMKTFHLPYPVTVGTVPLPGGELPPGGTVSVTLSPVMPPTAAAASTLVVKAVGSETAVPGSVVGTGWFRGFTPEPSLTVGAVYVAEAHLAASGVVGGHLRGAWRFPVVGGADGTEIALTGIAPDHGDVAGGTSVVLTGSNLEAVSKVYFGGKGVVPGADRSAVLLRVVTPAADVAGPVAVELETTTQKWLRWDGAFAYVAQPFVSGVMPATVSLEGGTVTFSGGRFTRGLSVFEAATPVKILALTGTSLTVEIAAGPAGPVALRLEQPGTPAVSLGALVSRADLRPPAVVSWSPTGTQGGQSVPVASQFTVRFDEAIAPASAAQAKLQRTVTGLAVAATVTVDPDGRGLTLVPSEPLLQTTRYMLSVAGVTDLLGNALVQGGTASFRTVDGVKPVVEIVVKGSSRPVVAGDRFSAQTPWTFEVRATDDSGAVSARKLSLDGVDLTGSNGSFTYTWPAEKVDTSSQLVAWAQDAAGNTEQTPPVTVQVVNDLPPTVVFTEPGVAALTLEEGAPLNVVVSATDNTQVRSLELRLDDASLKFVTAPTGPLTYTLKAPRVVSGPEVHVLTARALDDAQLLGSTAPVMLTVTPDTTAPAVTFLWPSTDARVVSGTSMELRVSATDTNAVTSVRFVKDGEDLGTLSGPTWRMRWNAPTVTVPTPVTLVARARDARGNEGTATRTVTVEPVSSPQIAFAYPSAGSSYVEGTQVSVRAEAVAPAGIKEVRLALEGQEVVATRLVGSSLWDATFTAPAVGVEGGVATVRAVVRDEAGVESTSIRQIKVTNSNAQTPTVALPVDLEGPVFAGGASASARATASMGATVHQQLFVADGGIATGSEGDVLPWGPEGAPVRFVAQASSLGGTVSAEAPGTLAVFAQGPAMHSTLDGVEAATALALQGEFLFVLRNDAGGGARVERRARADGALASQRSLEGEPLGLAVRGDRVAVVLRSAGMGTLALLSATDLSTVGSVALRREPSSVGAFRGGFAVGTDEGLELLDPEGAWRARLPLGNVTALSLHGDWLYALAGGFLHGVDLTVPPAPKRVAWVQTAGGAVTAVGAERACVVGTAVRCFTRAGDTLTLAGEKTLGIPAASVTALGPWLLAGSDTGMTVLDARAAPRVAGRYPAMQGHLVTSGNTVFAAKGSLLSRLVLARGPASPQVTLSLPDTAAPGARLALTATVSDGVEPLNAFTAELAVDGHVVEALDNALPTSVDLPVAAGDVQVTLRVRDLAGNTGTASRTVTRVDAGVGPTLVALEVPSEVWEGAEFPVRPVAVSPNQVARVEVSVAGGASGVFTAPAWAGTLRAPQVSADDLVTVTAVAVDSQGRSGPPKSVQLQVRNDTGSAPVLGPLELVAAGSILEGTRVGVLATTTPASVREVRFRVGIVGQPLVEQQRVVGSPYVASLLMPQVTGSTTVRVEAVAVDAAGRESAPVTRDLIVVDDATPPVVTVTVEPTAGRIAAGSPMLTRVTATDAGGVSRIQQVLSLDGLPVASGSGVLRYVVPSETLPGALLRLTVTVTDRAGLTSLVPAKEWRVVTSLSPPPGQVFTQGFAGAEQLELVGDRVFVRTATGFEVGQLTRGPTPSLTHLGRFTSTVRPRSIAVQGDRVLVAYGATGLDVVDVASPASPRTVGHVNLSLDKVVTYAGGAYASAGPESLNLPYSLDLEDPARPVATPVYYLLGSSILLAAEVDGFIYNIGGNGVRMGFRIGRWPGGTPPTTAYMTLLTGERVVAAERDGNRLVAATDRLLRVDEFWEGGDFSVPLAAPARAMQVAQGLAYVLCDDGFLRIIDVREPRSLAILATSALDARDVAVSGGVMLAASAAGVELRVLPLGQESVSATASATYATAPPPLGLTAFHEGVLVAAGTAGIRQLGLSRPGELEVLPGSASAGMTQVERAGGELYFLSNGSVSRGVDRGNGTFDVTGQSALGPLGVVTRFSAAVGRIWGINGQTVSSMTLLPDGSPASLAMSSSALDVSGEERHAAVALGTAGWTLVGVDGSGTLRRRATHAELPVQAVALDDTLLVTGNTSGLTTWRVTDDGGVPRATVPTAGAVVRIRLHGRLAVVSEAAQGVQLFDLEDPDAPRLVGSVPAGRAVDAILVGSDLVVADAFLGVRRFPVESLRAAPSVRIALPLPGTEVVAGSEYLVMAAASGFALNDTELWVNGRPVGVLDDVDSKAMLQVPAGSSAGSEVSLQLRVRSANGTSAFSEPVSLRVTVPVTSQPAPTLAIAYPTGTSFVSGEVAKVYVTAYDVVAPGRVRLFLGDRYLDEALTTGGNPNATFTVRMPVVQSPVTELLRVELLDGAGRSASAQSTVTLTPTPMFTTAPTGLPSVVRALPFVNLLQSDNFGWGHGPYTLELLVDGVAVATSEVLTKNPAATNVSFALRIPRERIGQKLSLTLRVRDPQGRSLGAPREYTVLDDGEPPVVQTLVAPASARSGDVISVSTSATDPNGDLASLTLLANGLQVATTTHWSLDAELVVPGAASPGQMALTVVALDLGGRQTQRSVTVQVQPNLPPEVKLKAVSTPLHEGYSQEFCMEVDDSSRLASVELRLNGTVIAQADDCINVDCSSLCMTVPVPPSAAVLSAMAVDVLGLSDSVEATYPVGANLPPRVSLEQSYLVAGRTLFIRGRVSDELPSLAWAEFSLDGSLYTHLDDPEPISDVPLTVAAGGPRVLTLEAMDHSGLRASVSRSLDVLPSGSGESCLLPVPLKDPLTYLASAAVADAPWDCSTGNHGTWVSLPFDGPVERLTFEAHGHAVVMNACGDSSSRCVYEGEPLKTLTALPAGARIFVESTNWSDTSTLRLISARLGQGAKCDPASVDFVCAAGTCAEDAQGGHRCQLPACTDGVDNEETPDGRVDYPFDPGCTSLEDTSEEDPDPLPACSNGGDDDLDLLKDFPQDPACGSAAGAQEVPGDGDSCVAPATITSRVTSVPLANASSDLLLTCSPAAPDRVYGFHFPGAGYVHAKATSAHVSLRSLCGRESSELSCDGSEHGSGEVGADLDEGTYFVLVSGTEDAELVMTGTLNPGSRCDPTMSWLQCESGSYCLPTGGELRCREAACSDGLNNEDGDVLTDYPKDPGCTSRGDDDERDLPVAPECANNLDDDGLHGEDWPADPGCGSAGGQTEGGGDGESCAGPQVITTESTPVMLVGATHDEKLGCGAPDPDRVFGLRLPGQAFIDVEALHASLALRSYACDRSSRLCSSASGGMQDGGTFARELPDGGIPSGGVPDGGTLDGGSWVAGTPGGESLPGGTELQGLSDAGTPSRLSLRAYAGESVFILVSGTQDTTLRVSGTFYSGERCDPSRPWFRCQEDESCQADGAEFRCVAPASPASPVGREGPSTKALKPRQVPERKDAGTSVPGLQPPEEASLPPGSGAPLASVEVGEGRRAPADDQRWNDMMVQDCGDGDCAGAAVCQSSGGGQ